MSFEFDEEEFERDVKIKVVGVGGGGGNAVENMVRNNVEGVDFIIVNTDVAALKAKDGSAMERVQIGRKTTKGRGAGGKPPVAAESAKENSDDIEEALNGASLVFVAAGMGGGTGTGAAPVIAEIAKKKGILTVGVVTKPFEFEREYKMNLALQGIAELRKYVDALIIVPNQKLLSIKEKNISIKAAYAMVDNVLYQAVKGISDLITHDGFINIDFEDVRSTLEGAGDAHMAIGHGSGDTRAEEAVAEVVNSPLLETSIKNAGKLLVNLTMSEDTPLDDAEKVMQLLTQSASKDVQVIHGVDFDSDLKDEMVITVIATCFKDSEGHSMITSDEAVAKTVLASTPTEDTGSEKSADSSFSESLIFPETPANAGESSDDDPFTELSALLNNRGN